MKFGLLGEQIFLIVSILDLFIVEWLEPEGVFVFLQKIVDR